MRRLICAFVARVQQTSEACKGVLAVFLYCRFSLFLKDPFFPDYLGMQDICHFISRDMGYYPFYFQSYTILCSIFLFSCRDIEYYRDTCPFTSKAMRYL